MKVSELKTGDILAIHGKSWLAKRIQYFMRVYAKKKDVDIDRTYNHTMIVIDDKIQEAIGRGVVRRDLFDGYKKSDLKRMCVIRYYNDLTETQVDSIKDKAQELLEKNVEYEFVNFLWWIPYIYSNGKINWSPRGKKAYKKVFCFELSAIILNAGINLFKKPSNITTVDLQTDARFDVYDLEE